MKRTGLLALVLCALLLLPSSVRAEQKIARDRISFQHLETIALGALVGGTIGFWVAVDDVTGMIVGGVIGGVVSDWWYRTGKGLEESATASTTAYPRTGGVRLRPARFSEER